MYVVNDERRNPIDFGSKIKVNLGALCIKPFGPNTDYSFSPITLKLCMDVVDDERRSLIIPSQQRWRGYSNAAVRGWLGE